MAIDELHLRKVGEQVVLRFYHWADPSWSFGCLQPVAEMRDQVVSGEPLVRRYTGGGAVHHGDGDLTFSLILPASLDLAQEGPAARYLAIHTLLGEALSACGVANQLVGEDGPEAGLGGVCFEAPVVGDLIDPADPDRRKLAGGGQRRTREGVLHQGSVLQDVPGLAEAFAEAFADCLGREVSPESRTPFSETELADLVTTRYGNPEWLSRR